jgi:acyclic terpene utilization AtuA family protein
MAQVAIGAGAGFAGDRTDAAGPVVAHLAAFGGPRFLMFETLAERTLALSQLERRRDPQRGFNPALERFVGPIIGRCLAEQIRIIGNFGAANPRAAAARIAALAREQGLRVPRIAVVEGDDIAATLTLSDLAARETGGHVLRSAKEVIAANVYLGAGPIAQALDQEADIVVTGRVADSALALGPLMHAFGWRDDDWDRLAAGTLAGHLVECGAQVTGGYFADPPYKPVAGMADIGYPIAEVDADGRMVVTKPAGTGGRVDRLTVVEQILYEIHDPAAYLAPDVVLDLTDVTVEETAPDRVAVQGARGKPAPATLKATVCIDGGVLGEAEISYAGPNAANRAALAAETVLERVRRRVPHLTVRTDAIGIVSVLGSNPGVRAEAWAPDATDVRLRFAAQSMNPADVEALLDEVEALYCAGPAGGCGVRRRVTPRLASASCLIERAFVAPSVAFVGDAACA